MKRNQRGYALMITIAVLFTVCGTIMWIVLSGQLTSSIYAEAGIESQEAVLYAREGLLERYFSHLKVKSGETGSETPVVLEIDTEHSETVEAFQARAEAAKLQEISSEQSVFCSRINGLRTSLASSGTIENATYGIQLQIGNSACHIEGDDYLFSIPVNVVDSDNGATLIEAEITLTVDISAVMSGEGEEPHTITVTTTIKDVSYTSFKIL